MKVLVIGSGGREHCLAWKLKESKLVDKLYIAPGNAGTSLIGENVDINPQDLEGLVKFAENSKIDLTVAGPEAPLVGGIVDRFESKGLKIFGPKRDLALLEGSKVYAKKIMRKFGIPTADFEVFSQPDLAKDYVRSKRFPLVIKADGLAAGKGAIVCKNREEAYSAIDLIMTEKKFGSAGENIVIEDFLSGEEASVLVFTDGETILPLVPSQDHKQVFDEDRGPNTGGMGAYAPAPVVNDVVFRKITEEIFEPLIRGLKKEGKVYKGMLYAGLMIKDNQPYVLEFNVRFGDPETQVILPKLRSDLLEVMLKTIGEDLAEVNLVWDERFCLCVVLASGGYPGKYEKGKVIKGLEKAEGLRDLFLFHAGTKRRDGEFITAGGRVLNVVGLAEGLIETQVKVYEAIKNIYFEGIHYRKDIGNKALKYL